jgi:hypothetical protein
MHYIYYYSFAAKDMHRSCFEKMLDAAFPSPLLMDSGHHPSGPSVYSPTRRVNLSSRFQNFYWHFII